MTIFNTRFRPGGRASAGMRRGNSIILVVGLIVLLLIIAISFITRAQGLRSTAAAYRDASVHDGSGDGIADHIAKNVAESLFVERIDPLDETGQIVIGPVNEDIRIRPDDSQSRYGVDPNFNWNYAPWSVVPWTNPPDWLTYPNKVGLQNEFYNAGAGQQSLDQAVWNDSLFTGPILSSRQNPRGGPGTSDTRWLRDLEPQRQSTQRDLDGNDENGYDARYADSFSHWRHLTNLSRPNNQWRIVRDIADVTGVRSGELSWDANLEMSRRGNWNWGGGWELSSVDGHHYHGGLVERLDVPVEQWPAQPPTNDEGGLLNGEATLGFNAVDSGQNAFTNPDDFWSRWMQWFDPSGYRDALLATAGNPGSDIFGTGYDWPQGNRIPPNFYDLSDLDGDGTDGEYYDPAIPGKLGEKPEDEFRKGTARWHVGRVLTDTDGDGFTDSFWWQSPHVGPSGMRQVVGVSVTDNAGRLNANVATRFIRNDSESGVPQEGTRGSTPADLALIGQGTPPFEEPWGITNSGSSTTTLKPGGIDDVWSVGFFDNRENWSGLLNSGSYESLSFESPLSQYSQDWLIYPDAIDEEDGGSLEPEVFVGFDPASFTGSGTLQDYLSELNVEYNNVFPDSNSGRDIHDRDNRLFYFQKAGLNPFDPGGFFTPMGISEELELRAYEGNNLTWLYGRFEQPIQQPWSESPYAGGGIEPAFLRAGQDREEISPLGEQLDNRQLVADNRRKLTFFNSTRNDTMPPWLWPENRFGRVSLADSIRRTGFYQEIPNLDELLDVDSDGIADEGFPRFVPYARDILEQLDLRTMVNLSGGWTPSGIGNGADKGTWRDYFEQSREKIDLREWERPVPRLQIVADTLPPENAYQGISFGNRLPMALLMALTSGEIRDSWKDRFDDVSLDYASLAPRETGQGGGVIVRSNPPDSDLSTSLDDPRGYSGDVNFEEARQTAAMLAANIQAWRDPDSNSPIYTMAWKDSDDQSRGQFGAVALPRLDGWELNNDVNDPGYDANYGDWRPAVEDMFIDAHDDGQDPLRNGILVDEDDLYDSIYQPFDRSSLAGACFEPTSDPNEPYNCLGNYSIADCQAFGSAAQFFPGLDCTYVLDVRAYGACCYAPAENNNVLTCKEWQSAQSGAPMNFRVCVEKGGRWIPEIGCEDLDCSQYESVAVLPLNMESPYLGDDFDGLGYPRLYDAYAGNLADPYRNASTAGDASNSGNWVNASDGGYSAAELNTREVVRNVRALGMEPQPFITEAFVTHVLRPTRIPNAGISAGDDTPGFLLGGYEGKSIPTQGANAPSCAQGVWSDANPMWLLVEGSTRAPDPTKAYSGNLGLLDDQTDPGYESPVGSGYLPTPPPADTVAVVQIANPYDVPIPLFDRVGDRWLPRYKIRLFGQEFPLSPSIDPQYEGRVSSLRGLIDAGANADDINAGLLSNYMVNSGTDHGLVLPPATHDRPYTLTIVSVPAAREDDFDPNRKRWSFFMEDGNQNIRGELDQWLDFLDLGLDSGILNNPTDGMLPEQTFQFEGEEYTVGPTDLIWVIRPAFDPENDGYFRPGDLADDWSWEENNDVRELWATNRLFYDGVTDPWTTFPGSDALSAPYGMLVTDEAGEHVPDIHGSRSFLEPVLSGGNNTVYRPKHAAVELVKVDRLDIDGNLSYNTSLRNQSIQLPSGEGYEYLFEYGDEPVNPNNGAFSLLFDNTNGGYPAQEIVIDRTLQQRDDGTWHDPLMEATIGMEWGGTYPAPGSSTTPGFDPSSLLAGSLVTERIGTLENVPGAWGPWVEYDSTTDLADIWQEEGLDGKTTEGPFQEDDSDRLMNPVLWKSDSNLFPSPQIGQDWSLLSGFTLGGGNAPNCPSEAEYQADYPEWLSTSAYRNGKAQSARFALWARYARPWGLDPDWPRLDDEIFHKEIGTPGGTPLEILTESGARRAPYEINSVLMEIPQRQMEYAAPRYVLGRGSVTRSHSHSWFERNSNEQLSVNDAPGDPQESIPSPLEHIEDPAIPLVDAGYREAARRLGGEKAAARYAEQRWPILQAQGDNQFVDADGNLIDVYIRDCNDDSVELQNYYASLPVNSGEYPSAKDHREACGAGSASLGHYEHFEMDSSISGYGNPGDFIDPDGVFYTAGAGELGGHYAGPLRRFPWITRNARMPRYIPDRFTPRSRFHVFYRNRKPTAFDMMVDENSAGYGDFNRWSFPDKGVYAVDELPAFDSPNGSFIYDKDSDGGYRYDENHLAPFSFQMNHKNGNFEQVGEVLNVWTHAHLISQPYRDFEYPGQPEFIPRPDPRVQAETIRTFSESLARELDETIRAARGPISYKVQSLIANESSGGIGSNQREDRYRYLYRPLMRDALRRVGRLEVSPNAYGRQQLVGEPVRDLASQGSLQSLELLQPWVLANTDLSHLEPIQPAGQRVLDLFVCDGPGIYDIFDNESYDGGTFVENSPDGIIDPENAYQEFTARDPSFMNAYGFSGKGTPGLVNINTASLEVLRTLPHMYRMVHGTSDSSGVSGFDVLDGTNRNPRVAVPEAMIQYRDMLGVQPVEGGVPNRSAPFVGGKEVVLQSNFQPGLDSSQDGSVQPFEYGINPGFDLGPSYSMRGSHTPVSHLGESLRCDTANLTYPYFDRTDAGYDSLNDWTYASDGIATGSGVRGFQGIGELFQLQSPGYRGNPLHTGLFNVPLENIEEEDLLEEDVKGLQGDRVDPNAWSIEFAAKRPFMFSREQRSASKDYVDPTYIDEYVSSPLGDSRDFYVSNQFKFTDIGAAISTDTSTIRDTRGPNVQYLHGKPHTWMGISDARLQERLLSGDMVAGDAEEANLLFSGLSNMITTRSDMFTVHFRVRTFKPNPDTGVWDATDPDAIVDDSRYVMLVDRSEVEKPGDQPKIVYVEKIDN